MSGGFIRESKRLSTGLSVFLRPKFVKAFGEENRVTRFWDWNNNDDR